MPGIELRVGGALPRAHLLARPVEQPAVVIAAHMNGVERHQRVHGPPRIKRSARHVAEVDDPVDALRANIGNHRFEREIVSVDIGNRSKKNRQPKQNASSSQLSAYPGGVPLAASTSPAKYINPVIRMRVGTS